MTVTRKLLTTAALVFAILTSPTLAAQPAPSAPPPTAAPAPTDADPALWVIRDADTTIYLFGTVHLLRPGLTWFDEAVRSAFDASDELKLEVILPENQQEMVPLIMRYAIDPAGITMTSRLTAEQRPTYTSGMAALGIPAAVVDQFEPWFIGVTVGTVLIQRAGFDPAAGADAVLRTAATSAGKTVSAFETAEQQIGFLDGAPAAEQITGIMTILGDVGAASAMFDQLVASWVAGDPDTTGRLLNEGMVNTPETARILLTDRNRRWADTLAARMDQPGTLFVAVGAGHLAGDQSVQTFLAARGLTATRIAY